MPRPTMADQQDRKSRSPVSIWTTSPPLTWTCERNWFQCYLSHCYFQVFYHPQTKQKPKGKLLNSFYEANKILTTKSDKDRASKYNYRSILFISTYAQILNKISVNIDQQWKRYTTHHDPVEFAVNLQEYDDSPTLQSLWMWPIALTE